MIGANNVTKKFDNFTALDGISCKIESGCIYGLVGSNGAGKSTFLRVLAGVYRADKGSVTIDGEPIYENPSVKKKILLVPDDLYFLPGASMLRMKKLYKAVYPDFDDKRFSELADCFGLDIKKNLNTFSKGMRRQAATVLALSARPEYIFFDETFDGLDPIMRNVVKRLICEDILDRSATAIITSHSLRELEDTCDQLSLLHKGGLVFESDIQNLKTSLFKVQIAFDHEYDESKFTGMDILKFTKRGSVSNIILRGDRDLTAAALSSMKPTLLDVLPLSLEEVFTYEMEALGYKISDMLEG